MPIPDLLPQIPQIAASVSALLAPLLPYLVSSGVASAVRSAGGKAVQKVGELVGQDVWNRAKEIWSSLEPKIEKSPDVKNSVAVFAADVDKDLGRLPQVTYALEAQLRLLLEKDPELLRRIEPMIREAEQAHNQGVAFNIQNQIAEKIINAGHIGILTVH